MGQGAAGDFEAEAKLLLERVRSGDLTEERLRLAVWLGDGLAALAVQAGALVRRAGDLAQFYDELVSSLPEFGEEAVSRAVCAVAWAAYANEPTPSFLLAADQLIVEGQPVGAFQVLLEGPQQDEDEAILLYGKRTDLDTAISQFDTGKFHLLLVYQAVPAELLPWALGTGDPVRDRVEARQRG